MSFMSFMYHIMCICVYVCMHARIQTAMVLLLWRRRLILRAASELYVFYVPCNACICLYVHEGLVLFAHRIRVEGSLSSVAPCTYICLYVCICVSLLVGQSILRVRLLSLRLHMYWCMCTHMCTPGTTDVLSCVGA